ncbi:MAG: ABC-2 type transport system permease protein [Rhodothermales bacterium]|jgi:ABC-2 type transport system permease protein
MKLFMTTGTLLWREIVQFLRQRNRVIGALLQPLLFWVLIGAGLNHSFRPGGASDVTYGAYFFPGILLMILLFTSIFSTISIIEDRNSGFLQGVLVAPVPRSGIVLGKILGGTVLGMMQALLFLALILTPMVDLQLSALNFVKLLGHMTLIGVMLTALGTFIAWGMESSQGYHAIMSVFLFPLWIFSGAAFPVEGTPTWLHTLMVANPLTHGLYGMRNCFTGGGESPTSMLSLGYVVLCAVVLFALSVRLVRRKS